MLKDGKLIAGLFISLTALLCASCATYNRQAASYYQYLKQGNYSKAGAALDKNKLLQKQRNRVLYLLERGKICHLLGQWDSSNTYLNEADTRMEDASASAKDIVIGNLINPMMQDYRPEPFERYLVHYYKALNYLQLNQPEEAMVEAKRISLTSYAQQDKAGKNKYGADAFALMLQGLIYERNADINNAFIAYRNAADVYLENGGSFYETTMPVQLKQDLLRTASQMGFIDEFNRYQKLLNYSFRNTLDSASGGELILFWENGSAPVKTQKDFYFSLFKEGDGNFFFRDANGLYNVPYDLSNGNSNVKPEDIRSFRVALPQYETQPLNYREASILLNGRTITLEPTENVNALAITTLRERFVKELSSTLTRLAIKKLAEAAVRPSDKKTDNGKTDEEKKKQEKKDNQREAIALGLQLFNFVTEKADTRNWQSLPHSIYYARIPLQKGMNNIALQLTGNTEKKYTIDIDAKGGMYFKSISTLQ